jgi:transposase
LLTLAEPPERLQFRLAWSTFRRRHQAGAKRCHAARRARAPSAGIPTIQVLSSGDFRLTDEQWARIAAVLPPQKPATGRPANDHRRILAGLFWMIRTGASWRDVPEEFGPWQTINSRYQRWRQAGIWQQILDALRQEDGYAAAS